MLFHLEQRLEYLTILLHHTRGSPNPGVSRSSRQFTEATKTAAATGSPIYDATINLNLKNNRIARAASILVHFLDLFCKINNSN